MCMSSQQVKNAALVKIYCGKLIILIIFMVMGKFSENLFLFVTKSTVSYITNHRLGEN